MTWQEPVTWVGTEGFSQPKDTDVRLAAYPEGCQYRRSMISALQREGRPFDIVYTSPSLAGIEAAVSSGFGITALATRVVPPKLKGIDPSRGLPALADVVVGIYLRDGREGQDLEMIAACFADLLAN